MTITNAMNSRIGKLPIALPNKVSVSLEASTIKVVGPKGSLEEKINNRFSLQVDAGFVKITPPQSHQRSDNALYGLYRALLYNMVQGVSVGYKKELELIGVGYRASLLSNNILDLNLGYSHAIYFQVPAEVKVEVKMEKNKPPRIILESYHKALLGQLAAKIKSMRKAEPYKGKGIKEVGEYIVRKQGKTTSKK